MAKLEGVKVLDMKYGEILRVEYGGEIYEKVDDKAKDGDIVQVVDGFGELTSGDFAKVNDSNGFVWVYDGTGERAIYNGRPDKVIVFRKISVQPSLADRVATVEAKINDLSSRVDKLEGKTGKEISASLIKKERPTVGDFVKVIKDGIHQAKIGDYAKIVENDKSDIPFKCEDLNGWNVGWFREDEVEKVTDENVLKFLRIGRKPGEFKVGDIVRFKGTDGVHGLKGYEGVITEVIDVDEGSYIPIELAIPPFRKTDFGSWSKKCDVELVAPVEARVDRP